MMIRDDRDSVIYHETIHFTGRYEIEGFTLYLAPEKAPLGKLEMVTGTDTLHHISKAVVSFSQSWVVTNFNDLLDMLKYFGQDSKISEMRKAKAQDRGALWRDFNKATDPNPATQENEALEQYFARLAYANYKFRDEGVAGWKTDRGEAFIILGEPDEIIDKSMESTFRYFVWTYNVYSVQLVFQDLTGFTRFRLVPESRVALDILKLQVQRPR
jgi:GWxTD domain-containing protein